MIVDNSGYNSVCNGYSGINMYKPLAIAESELQISAPALSCTVIQKSDVHLFKPQGGALEFWEGL